MPTPLLSLFSPQLASKRRRHRQRRTEWRQLLLEISELVELTDALHEEALRRFLDLLHHLHLTAGLELERAREPREHPVDRLLRRHREVVVDRREVAE